MGKGAAGFLPVSRSSRYDRSSTGLRWVWSTGAPKEDFSGKRFTVTQSPGVALLSEAPLAASSPSLYFGAAAKAVLQVAGLYKPWLNDAVLPSSWLWSVEPGHSRANGDL